MNKIITLFLLLTLTLAAQDNDPYKILDSVKSKFEKIEDYEVNASIKIDVNFLKMPDSKAKIYFKKPDKVKLKSEGFAMLPRNGVSFSPAALLSGDYDAIFIGNEVIENKSYLVVKVIPKSDSAGIILTTLKIDPDNYVISYVESNTKSSGAFNIKVDYLEVDSFHLPAVVTISFNMGDLQIPKAAAAQFDDQNKESEKDTKKDDDQMTGTVIVTYSDYKVNIGLPDELFVEEKKPESHRRRR